MNGRHVAAQGRVQRFVKAWHRRFTLVSAPVAANIDGVDLLITDLETLLTPRQVIRTLPELQALPVGTIIVTQGERAAQVEAWTDVDDNGELIEVKRLIYAGTDLYDHLRNPDPETRDTLRRMLPATVIDTKDA